MLKSRGDIVKDTFPKNIELFFSIPGDIWTLSGDPTQMQQIFLTGTVSGSFCSDQARVLRTQT
jgi:hypothetical protein